MSIDRYRNDNPRDAEEVAESIEATLQSIRPDAPVIQGTQNYAIINSFAETIAEQQEQALGDVYQSAYLTDATNEELTKKAREIGVKRQPATASTGVIEFQRDSDATTDYSIPSGTVVGAGGDDTVRFKTTESTTITSGTQTAQADIECTETGSVGNVGANTITVIVSGAISGVDSVTNPKATGDPTFTLTDGSTVQRAGQPRESDSSLRDRALDSTAIGGAGTVEATELALENISEVNSADVITNRSGNVVNNIDPWHTEVRIYGGEISVIADKLYETLPLATLKTLQGGANGTSESVTLDRSDLFNDITVSITRPTQVSLEISIDVVHTAAYAGTNAAKNAIVEYIGGVRTNGETSIGLTQGQNVLVNTVEAVVEGVDGVDYADVTLLDANSDGTDDTTTDADGVPIYDVSDSEIAIADATNITVSETAR